MSSTVSCSSPVTIEAVSSFIWARRPATSTGCEKYGSPEARSCGAVRLHRIDIGAVERVLVGVRVVGFDPLDQLELPHHDAAVPVALPAPAARRSTIAAASRAHARRNVTGSGTCPAFRAPRRDRRALRLGASADRHPHRPRAFLGELLGLVRSSSSTAASSRSSISSSSADREQSSSISSLDGFLVEFVLADHRAGRIGDAEQRRVIELAGLLRLVDLDMLLHAAHHRHP